MPHVLECGTKLEAQTSMVGAAVLGPGVLRYCCVYSQHKLIFQLQLGYADQNTCVAIAAADPTNPPAADFVSGLESDKGAVSASFHCSQAVLNHY